MWTEQDYPCQAEIHPLPMNMVSECQIYYSLDLVLFHPAMDEITAHGILDPKIFPLSVRLKPNAKGHARSLMLVEVSQWKRIKIWRVEWWLLEDCCLLKIYTLMIFCQIYFKIGWSRHCKINSDRNLKDFQTWNIQNQHLHMLGSEFLHHIYKLIQIITRGCCRLLACSWWYFSQLDHWSQSCSDSEETKSQFVCYPILYGTYILSLLCLRNFNFIPFPKNNWHLVIVIWVHSSPTCSYNGVWDLHQIPRRWPLEYARYSRSIFIGSIGALCKMIDHSIVRCVLVEFDLGWKSVKRAPLYIIGQAFTWRNFCCWLGQTSFPSYPIWWWSLKNIIY